MKKHSPYVLTPKRLEQIRRISQLPKSARWYQMMTKTHKGKKLSKEQAENLKLSWKGKHHTEETKRKIGDYWLGRKRPESTRLKMSLARKGKRVYFATEETRRKIGDAHRGEKNWQWKKDRTTLSRISKQGERRTSAYFFWRKSVWTRDDYKCKLLSESCSGRIEAHHILSWTDYPELRYQINNGITLCHAHHPRKRAEEKRLIPMFQELVSVSKE